MTDYNVNPLEFLYTDKPDSIDPAYHFPAGTTRENWRKGIKVADIPKKMGDGQDCEIYEFRYPARFYKLVVKDTPNSMGEINPGFCLLTGSGGKIGQLVFKLAHAIADGMIGLCQESSND